MAKSLRDAIKQTMSLQRLSRQSSGASRTISDESMISHWPNDGHSYDVSSADDILDADPLPLEEVSLINLSYTTSSSDVSSNSKPFGSHEGYSSHETSECQTPVAIAIADATRNDAIDIILTKDSWSILPVQFEEDQASLLMHFFDHVLPLQFRFYNPSILEGGRGWLLSILTRTKPLYHVALSLAAYHQQSILVRESGISCTDSLAKLQERHIECIKVLRYHLEKFSVRAEVDTCGDTVEIMACIALLIALEVSFASLESCAITDEYTTQLFRGDTNDWQMHLQAASTLSLKFGQDQLQRGPLYHTHKRAMEFFTGVITWYDILSCASTGLKPFSNFDYVDEAIFPHIHFDKLMGCETWLMRLILEIATLREWKSRLEASGTLSTWELVRRAADIEMRLETGLIASSKHPDKATPSYGTPTTTVSSVPESHIKDITRIFASAAIVYLQVIVSGPNPEISEIQQGVSRTMAALDTLKDKDLVRNLLWPVCIAGSMAMSEHELYWRNLVSSVSRDRWSFGYPSKVLKIMEECWSLRKCQPGIVPAVDWMTAMKNLDMRVLLV